MDARLTAGFEAKLAARTARQRERVLAVMQASGERAHDIAASLTPIDTGFMVSRLLLERIRDGFGYTFGWRAVDFIGQLNKATGRVIDVFYPRFIVFGTRFMAGRDPLTPALKAERPKLLAELRAALSA